LKVLGRLGSLNRFVYPPCSSDFIFTKGSDSCTIGA